MQDNKRIEKEKKFWDKLSPKYDQFIQKWWKIYASTLLDKISEDVSSSCIVLEVACGTGLVALKIAEKASRVYGVDISSQMISEAKKKMTEKGFENVDFSIEDAYNLPFDNNMFDTVICNNALHNMVNPQKALSEINRVLKPKGQFIATIVGIGEKRKYKIAMAIYHLFGGKLPTFHKLNLDESTNMIAESGFAIVKKETIKHPEDRMPILYTVAERRK